MTRDYRLWLESAFEAIRGSVLNLTQMDDVQLERTFQEIMGRDPREAYRNYICGWGC
jgi:hypothetical protein